MQIQAIKLQVMLFIVERASSWPPLFIEQIMRQLVLCDIGRAAIVLQKVGQRIG